MLFGDVQIETAAHNGAAQAVHEVAQGRPARRVGEGTERANWEDPGWGESASAVAAVETSE